jgi:hypothetical protein
MSASNTTRPARYLFIKPTRSSQLVNMAFNILLIPAMSSETERGFSGAKLTLSPSRNRLSEDVIEATECLNRWYKAGL